jgi:predicted dehydrogenase
MGVNEALPVRWHPEFSGGGALTDMGVHAIVAAWFLAGFHLRPVRAQAIRPVGVALRMPRRLVNGRFERMTVEDDAHVVLDLESPATGARVAVHVEAAWCGLDRPGTRIIGSTGDLYVEDPLRLVDSWGNAHEIPVQQPLTGYGIAERRDPEYSGFVGMVREMCRCVQDGQTPVYDARRAAEAMAVIGACYLSEMRDGAGVTIDEFRDYSMALRRREGDAAADVFIRQVSEHICTAASCRL